MIKYYIKDVFVLIRLDLSDVSYTCLYTYLLIYSVILTDL